MLPFCFEWDWSPDRLIFIGLLNIALIAIGCGLLFVLIKTFLQVMAFLKEDDHSS